MYFIPSCNYLIKFPSICLNNNSSSVGPYLLKSDHTHQVLSQKRLEVFTQPLLYVKFMAEVSGKFIHFTIIRQMCVCEFATKMGDLAGGEIEQTAP